jgi:hypothetical protein
MAEFPQCSLGDAIEQEDNQSTYSFTTVIWRGRDLSRDLHLTELSLIPNGLYTLLISTPTFAANCFCLTDALTACCLVLNKAICLELGDEDGHELGIGEF